jgi:CheY-like chemotaxis protein
VLRGAIVSRLVLVADANPDRADRIREACAVRGFATRAVANGADALESCVADLPEVLVTVGALALIDAPKLVEILRTNPRTRRVRFVFLSDGDAAGIAEWGAVQLPLDADPDEVGEQVAGQMARSIELETAVGEAREEVEGRLSQIPLADLLQLFHLNRRSGTVELRRRTDDGRTERGRVHLRDGDVVQAVTGPVDGEKALFRLLGWNEGSFAFRSEPIDLEPRVTTTTRALLMEGMRQLDEWRGMRSELPSLDAHVALRVRSSELPSVVHPLTQEVLLLLELYSLVGDVVDHSSFPDYQVLRTLQTLVQRGIVEVRPGAPVPAPDAGLFRPAQLRRLREWLELRGDGTSARDAKLVVASARPEATRDFFRRLRGVPGMVPHPHMEDGIRADALGPIARLRLEDDLGIEFVHLPTAPGYAPLWPFAGYGALGTLLLVDGVGAEAIAALEGIGDALRALPRARVFRVVLLDAGQAAPADEIRSGVDEDPTLILLPLDDRRDPLELMRGVFSRLVP